MTLPRIEIDLARPPGRAHRATPVLLLAALALVVAVTGLAQRDAARLQDAEAALAAAQAAARGPARAASRPGPLQLRAAQVARAVQREIETPWPQLLASLEAGVNRDVAVLSVQPEASRREVRVELEARHRRAMLDYLDGLQQDARLSRVVLLMHEYLGEPGTPGIRFQVQASWGTLP